MSLATLTQVKDYMGIAVTRLNPETDNLISDVIDRISTMIETYCDRTFTSTEHTEYYDGMGVPYFYTNNYPITSVSGIWDDMNWEWQDGTLLAAADYRISEDNRRIRKKSGYFMESFENIKITYTAGYSTLPYDLSHVCIEEVVRVYKHKSDPGVYSKTVGNDSVERNQLDLLPSTLVVLNNYRRLGIY